MVVLPINLTNKTLDVILTDNNGKSFKAEAIIANNYRNFKAGYARWISVNDFLIGTYLTFTADEEQTFTMSKSVETLEYSVNGKEWATLGTTTVVFGGKNGDLQLRGRSKIGTASSTSSYSTIKFGNTTPVICYGDIRSLIDYTLCKTTYITSIFTGNARFCYLFKDCTVLKSSPTLAFTNLADYCFYHMFSGCSNLISPPKLPAQFLTTGCYAYMFYNNSNLITPPELPATDLAAWCYQYMFYGCEKLSFAPELPATTLVPECYKKMFAYCSSLVTTPKLPAWKLATSCYSGMFSSCSNLTNAPELPATLLTDYCYDSMFANCSNLSIAPKLPASTLAIFCYSFMFQNTALKNAPQLPAATLKRGCYQAMFSGCKNLKVAPQLSAIKLENACYERMFENCINLNNVTMLATDITAFKSLSNWLSSVASSGTFTKAKEMESLPNGTSGIPTGWTVKNYGEE